MGGRGGLPLPWLVVLQVVEPWSKFQLCPPTLKSVGPGTIGEVSGAVVIPLGNPTRPLPLIATVLTFAGSLFSKRVLSGMKTDPAVAVKTFGDMFASDGGSVANTYPWFPAG